MRFVILAFALIVAMSPAGARPASAPFTTLQSATDWINSYRANPEPARMPAAVVTLSRFDAFKDFDASGVYVGFIAGVIGANPDRAETLIRGMLVMRPEDHWVIVRAVAYSGHPSWRLLLRKFSGQMPTRRTMIDDYIEGKLPTLDSLDIKLGPTTFERVRDAFRIGGDKPKIASLEPSSTVLDTLWGYYLGSGSWTPVTRIIAMLVWSKDRDNVERLTVGSMAKYTLAANASRDPNLLAVLKHYRNARQQNPDIKTALGEVIAAAETADTGKLRRDALAAIETLKTKGPGYKRELSNWGKVGQGAIAVGCVVAAATGQVEFGLPCVIGGGATSAALYYMNDR
jgi:hypothetical protein